MLHGIIVIHGLYHGFVHLKERTLPFGEPARIIDLAGYGRYAATSSSHSLPAQAEHVIDEMDRYGFATATLVGHSVGGVVAMLAAARRPGRIRSVVNVEGNFTVDDAFWSAKLAAMTPAEVELQLAATMSDLEAWLRAQRIAPTPASLTAARRMFEAQPAATVHAVAQSVVTVTSRPDYLATVDEVLDSGLPVHLFAGERSRADWHVPESVVRRAAGFTVQEGVGHLMPLEAPDRFLELLAPLTATG